jgi:hypothetical protein
MKPKRANLTDGVNFWYFLLLLPMTLHVYNRDVRVVTKCTVATAWLHVHKSLKYHELIHAQDMQIKLPGCWCYEVSSKCAHKLRVMRE